MKSLLTSCCLFVFMQLDYYGLIWINPGAKKNKKNKKTKDSKTSLITGVVAKSLVFFCFFLVFLVLFALPPLKAKALP